jgi:uncharacterized RDD family membrane protein YckC
VLLGQEHYYGYIENDCINIRISKTKYEFKMEDDCIVGRVIPNIIDLLILLFLLYCLISSIVFSNTGIFLFAIMLFSVLTISYLYAYGSMRKRFIQLISTGE